MQPPECGVPDTKYSDEKDFIPIPGTIQYNKYYHMDIHNVLQKFRRGIKSAMRKGVKSRQACQSHCLSKSEMKEVRKLFQREVT